MLACLLLDRGRHQEAAAVFRTWHEQEFHNPLFNFLLGLTLFLSGEDLAADLLFKLVGMPPNWFIGVTSDSAAGKKLLASKSAQNIDPIPYVFCLERLLEFGLPSLVFTFLDQCGILPPDMLACEPMALIDAKATALDRDFEGAATKLEELFAKGAVSREAHRLAGECYHHLGDVDRSLQELQLALPSQVMFDEPETYLLLGNVLIMKKRWNHAREAFLRSIKCKDTAVAWSGVGYAEFRSGELQSCYEALCKANLLDDQRSDTWAQLCLLYLRFDAGDLADNCLGQCLAYAPVTNELLLEVATESLRVGRPYAIPESAARAALQAQGTAEGRNILADILAQQGKMVQAIAEAKVALGMFPKESPLCNSISEKITKWQDEVGGGFLQATGQ